MRVSRQFRQPFRGIHGRRFWCLALLFVFPLLGADRPPKKSETRREIDRLFEKYRRSFPDVPVITVKEYLDRREKEGLLLVDARTPEERAVSTIPGALTREHLERNREHYAERKVVILCTIGYRSAEVAEELSRSGVGSLNLKGGILAWAHAGQTLIDEDGETRRVHTYGPRWALLPEGYEAVW